MRLCVVCRREIPPGDPYGRPYTCSEECHVQFVDALERVFGPVRRVGSLRTGKTHLVPTRVILEDGLRECELELYPEAGIGV